MDRTRAFDGRSANSTIFHNGNGFYYLLKEKRPGRLRLKCRHHRRCSGSASISLSTFLLTHLNPHNHLPDPDLPNDYLMRSRIIADASVSTVGRTPRQILNAWKLRCPNPELASRFTAARMKSAIHAARSNNYPKIPGSLMSLGILLGLPDMQAICTTIDKQDLIIRGIIGVQGNRTVSVVFASWRMIQFLASRDSLHLDGTFKRRPKKPNCRQIYNITTKYGETVICVMRVLMMSKSEEAYLTLFRYVKTLAPNLNPSRVHCDFEEAQINALRIIFPGTDIVGCLWHYGVACSGNARKLGLAVLAQENDLVFSYIRCLAGAPLLPPDMIMTGVDEIWTEIEATRWRALLEPLFSYFRREWSTKLQELSVYSFPERTNNCSESDNHSLCVLIPKTRPSVWQCVGGFVQLEYLAWQDKLACGRATSVNQSRKWSAVLNDRTITRLTGMLERREITPGQFLHSASYTLIGAVRYGLRLRRPHDESSDDSSSSNSSSDESASEDDE